ncbi:MAG: DUF3788 domain-containing protein [Methanomassiliicoccaceae archaeon]|nr:DUF3788 domain-containing protein [Methanomassiliicoccaceae archaeon]
MNLEEQQLLRDPGVEPTSEVVAEGLGSANSAYTKFIEELEKNDIQVDWRYYNDGKAWLGKALYKWTTARGTQKETTVFWLSIWDGFFKISLFIPEKARADALGLSLTEEMKKMIGDSKQMGKLKFFPLVFDLRSEELFDELFILIDFKKTMK